MGVNIIIYSDRYKEVPSDVWDKYANGGNKYFFNWLCNSKLCKRYMFREDEYYRDIFSEFRPSSIEEWENAIREDDGMREQEKEKYLYLLKLLKENPTWFISISY